MDKFRIPGITREATSAARDDPAQSDAVREQPGDPPKPELLDQTINETASYLHAKDSADLKAMVAAHFKDLDQSVDDWIMMWGGVDAADYQVSYKSPGGAYLLAVATFGPTHIRLHGLAFRRCRILLNHSNGLIPESRKYAVGQLPRKQ